MNTSSLRGNEGRDYMKCLQVRQLSSKMKVVIQMAEQSATENRILESLHYQRMQARREKTFDAHAQTFEWIFDPHTSSNGLPSKDSLLNGLPMGKIFRELPGRPDVANPRS